MRASLYDTNVRSLAEPATAVTTGVVAIGRLHGRGLAVSAAVVDDPFDSDLGVFELEHAAAITVIANPLAIARARCVPARFTMPAETLPIGSRQLHAADG